MKRRNAIKNIAAGVPLLTLGLPGINRKKEDINMETQMLKGRINHAVCRWPYQNIPFDDFCITAKEIGIKGIDLLGPDEWKDAARYGLICSMTTGNEFGLEEDFNDLSLHEALWKNYEFLIPAAADNDLKNVICFSGNRNGLSDEQGLENCAKGLDKMVKLAEKYDITLVMELLNSRVDHPGYQCDHTEWGVALSDKIGSDHFKLLYDIYHMQIMEGDVIRTIKKYQNYIAHYHTGGVPGRHEIDETQELYYPAIMQAIVETGFKGFVAQEFMPAKKDKLASLKEAVLICDV